VLAIVGKSNFVQGVDTVFGAATKDLTVVAYMNLTHCRFLKPGRALFQEDSVGPSPITSKPRRSRWRLISRNVDQKYGELFRGI